MHLYCQIDELLLPHRGRLDWGSHVYYQSESLGVCRLSRTRGCIRYAYFGPVRQVTVTAERLRLIVTHVYDITMRVHLHYIRRCADTIELVIVFVVQGPGACVPKVKLTCST